MWAGILAFIQVLPELFSLWKSLKNVFGDNADKFLADLDQVTKKVELTKNPNMSIEEKRKIRVEALIAGRDIWSRIPD